MSLIVYALCALTSLGCCVLLLRHYQSQREKVLFHSAIAFLCFAAANILLFVDLVLVPQIDFRFWRNLITLIGVSLLLGALIGIKSKDKR